MKKNICITRKSRLNKIIPILFLFILTIIFFSPVLFQGKTFYAFDSLLEYLPWSSNTPAGFRPQNALITDPVNLSFPGSRDFKTCIDKKTLPLWNASIFCGTPLGGGASTAYTSPIPFFSYTFLPILTAHDVLLWVYLLGAGLFMYLFLQKIGLGILPALVGAISWMFNGYIIVWFEFDTALILATSLPAALLCFERWKQNKTQLNALCFIGALAISISSGFAHIIIYQTIFISCYVLYRYFSSMKSRPMRITKKDVKSLLIPMFLGACIAATFFTAHLSLLNQPQRQNYSFQDLYKQTGEVPPKYLLTLIFPDFFGNPATKITFTPRPNPPQPYNNYNELCIYGGILPLFLVLACLPFLFRRKFLLFFFLSAILSLTMAMGSILYYPLMKFIPGLSLSTPTRILYLFAFSLCVLAAIGADILVGLDKKKKWLCFGLWFIIPAITIGISLIVQTPGGIKWAADFQRWPNWDQIYGMLQVHFALIGSVTIVKPLLIAFTTFLLLTLILFSTKQKLKTIFLMIAILVLSYDLISFGLIYNTASPKYLAYPETEAIRFLKRDKSLFRIMSFGNFLHNSFSPFGIEDIGGYSSFYPRRYGEFIHLSQFGTKSPMPDNFSRWMSFRNFGSPLLNLINTKYLLLPPSWTAKVPGIRLVYDKEIKIYENEDVFPRVFFVPSYQYCASPKETLAKLASSKNSDLKNTVFLEEHPPNDFLQKRDHTGSDKVESSIKVVSYKSDSMDVEVSSNQNGFLVISNAFDPGWKARVDGVETKVLHANYIIQALPIRAGDHSVEVFFRPTLSIASLIISSLGWILLILLVGIYVIRKTGQLMKGGR